MRKTIYVKTYELLYDLKKTVYFYRINNYYKALFSSEAIIKSIVSLVDLLMQDETDLREYLIQTNQEINQILENITCAQKASDYILLADLYELQLQDWLLELQKRVLNNETCQIAMHEIEKNADALPDGKLKKALLEFAGEESGRYYQTEFTVSGEVTLYRMSEETNFYYHSNSSPRWEGFVLSNSWYQSEVEDYCIYGMGLGYAVLAMLEEHPFVNVTVLESNLELLYLAFTHHDFSAYLKDGRLQVVYDEDYTQMSHYLAQANDGAFVVFEPAMKDIKVQKVKESLESYFMQYHSIQGQKEKMAGNFRKNIKRMDPNADELKEKIEGQNVYIIAAGPSLDKNFRLLKEKKDGIILATGTVFKKLMKEGIAPDYIIITDANETVYEQIRDSESLQIPLIYLSTANYKIAANYQGSKYMLLQEGYPDAEAYAKEKGNLLFQTGGSVTTTALDFCVSLGCKKVIFLGLDLAYSGGYTHAANTAYQQRSESDSLITILDINGMPTKTSRNLNIYRKWIESYILTHNTIDYIDATEGGARVEGTQVKALSEVL